MRLILCFLLLISNSIFGQNIVGKIYENEVLLPYIQIKNISQNVETFSDGNGFFSINAKVNDSILFSSSFYAEKIIVVKDDHHNTEISIQLKQRVNDLDEVTINYSHFNEERFNSSFKQQMLNDAENNMQAYEEPSNGNVDFRKIFKRINKLFSKKNKDRKKTSLEPTYASYAEIKGLFLNNNFTDKNLLTDVLDIREENEALFIDFCRGKIERQLFSQENNFLLLDTLINLSLRFKKIQEE